MTMFRTKRWVILTAAVAVAISGLGLYSASASERLPAASTTAQDGGAWLGVGIEDTDSGVMVAQVATDSPASAAGVSVGDVIVAVDDVAITSAAMLVTTIQGYAPGDTVTLTLSRDDEERNVDVALGERPATTVVPMMPVHPFADERLRQGVLNFLGLEATMTDAGLEITAIAEDSPLVDLGFQTGDVITAINGEAVTDLVPRNLMGALHTGATVSFTVQRGEEELTIDVTIPEGALGFSWMMPGGEYGFDFGMDDMPFGTVQAAQPTQLGVQFVTLTPELADEQGLDVSEGALVTQVYDGTPAAEAGLQADDIIAAVAGEALDQERTLTDRLYAYEEGDVVALSVLRGGESLELEVTLGPRAGYGMYGFGPGNMPNMPHMFDQGFGMYCFPMPYGEGGQGFGPGMGQGFGPGMHQGFGPGMRQDLGPGMHQGFGHGMGRFGQQGMMPFFFGENMPDMDEFFQMHPFFGGEGFQFDFGTPDTGAETSDVPAGPAA